MNVSIILGVIGGLLISISFIPYIRDILKAGTEPHTYTWFIWSVTQTIAAYAIYEGGGGAFAAISVASGAVLSFIVFLMCFKHGTKDISRFDSVTLATALFAIVVWWKLDHPELAIIAIAIIDLLGFLPTFRKTWRLPKSESATAWLLFLLGNIAALLALDTYSIMTSFYIITMIISSTTLLGVVYFRNRIF